jgi:hypothetical protein
VYILCPPWEPGLESQRNLVNNTFELCLRENGDGLVGGIQAIGRDRDAPAHPEEEAWVNAAVPRVPGMKQVWGPDWTLPVSSLEAVTVALPALQVRREFGSRSLERLRGIWRCTTQEKEFRLAVDWKKTANAGKHGITLARNSQEGTLLTSEGPPMFARGVLGALGLPEERRVAQMPITPQQVDSLMSWAMGYAPDQVDYLWCHVTLGG